MMITIIKGGAKGCVDIFKKEERSPLISRPRTESSVEFRSFHRFSWRWKLCEPTTAMLDGCPIVSCSSCPTLVVPPLNSQDHSKIFLCYKDQRKLYKWNYEAWDAF
ncbi:hypothetical protein OPV22_032987 [Ensete ventricosum]|uniref:Uncharacterized protein n=1 Tax=Ensete ventricosum TaxID=4639 RepID=A0AAV8P0J6_ENSVE|nr:hypothetical protein OPV22_032987 [Ensete ventricosum]